MTMDGGVPTCRRCGYLLVGFPPPSRCPECGFLPTRRERWLEGELHLEGPRVVMPVMLRCVAAAGALVLALLSVGALDQDFLSSMKVPLKIDATWARVAIDLALVLVAILWSRPVSAQGARDFGIDRTCVARRRLPWLQLPWLLHAALLLAAIDASRKGKPVEAMTHQVTLVTGVLAQGCWLLSLRHAARLADFLRDALVRRLVNAWTWIWPGVSLLMLAFGWSASRYGSGDWPTGTLHRLWLFSNAGLLLGCVIAVMLAWTLGQCLALAHENEAAEQRKARREATRYHVPD
mgnify:FL=1